MGCGTSKSKSKSKLQDEEDEEEEESPSPAVALCRERCDLLEIALRQRFTFAQAHAAYFLSLDSFALSLHRFSILNLPSPSPNSHSDDSDSHSDPSHSRLHHTYVNVPPDPDYRDGAYFFNTTYMKNHTTPSLLHTQPQKESMYVAQAQLFSASPPSSNNNNNPVNPSPHSTATSNKQNQNPAASYSYPNHNFINTTTTTTNYGDAGPEAEGGVLGANSSLPAAPSSSSTVPPPPPPPRNLAWDFLNPFDTTVGSFYPAGHDSREKEEREARGAEGIPDLEDDVLVVKEIHVDQRFLSGGSGIHSKPSVADHSALARERIKEGWGNASAGTSFKGGEPQVVREIQLQFERASDSGSELAKFLEVGKLPYNGKSKTTQAVAVASKILHVPLPSLCKGTDPTVLDLDEDSELSSINLSSTLHKLRLWEKKMYKEVKFEEKMRVIHERKSRGLKHLDERGAEKPKFDATRNLVRSLSTKIKISMQVVDKISAKINDLRDGELWPQLHELIHRLTRMWRSMAECHGNQWRAIREAKQYLDGIEFQKQQFGDVHCEATCQLERDLINWSLSFSCWVAAQKDYAHMLNNWLMKCLHYVPEPEETADGIPPFSPGRIGAPPVFVICNEWSKSMNRISEKEVMESMREFASHVLLLWDQVKAEMSSLKKKKDGRKFNKSLQEKEDHRMRKEIHALDKRMMLLTSTGPFTTGSGVSEGEEGRGQQGTLQASLKHVLEAMENFAASSLKIYQDLLKHIDELRLKS